MQDMEFYPCQIKAWKLAKYDAAVMGMLENRSPSFTDLRISQSRVVQISDNDSLGVMKSSQRVKTCIFLNKENRK